jgi:hypothetical protein
MMKSRTKALISFGILVFLVFGLYYFTNWFSKVTGFALGEDDKLAMAQCLDGKGVVLYVSATCPKCDEQLEMFGNTAARFIEIYGCGSVEDCQGIRVLPAWKINGLFYDGYKNFKELEEISGCRAEKELADFVSEE